MDDFTRGYVAAALWTEGFEGLTVDDIHPESLAEMESDCKRFQEENNDLLNEAWEKYELSLERAGHDFWLTRNSHGAGFWDRGMEALGEQLTAICNNWGGTYLEEAEGKIYLL